MSRQVTIKQPRDKRESRLTEVENRNQKASVYHHRQVAVLVASMSTHTTQRKRDFGSTEPEPRLCGNMVTTVNYDGRTTLDLWECDRCGFVLEGVRL